MKQPDIVKHKLTRHKGWSRLRRPKTDAETTRQYTEQEIQSLSRAHDNVAGIIRPDTGDLHLPSSFADSGYGKQADGAPRVMPIIITLALIFIAIITYLVSQMPQKG